jgi:Predicted transcription factor, homolog of eukaryotic MBF1
MLKLMGEPLHERITRLRKARGLSVYRLAQLMNVKTPTAQAWERPKDKKGSQPKRQRMEQLARHLGVTVHEIELGIAAPPSAGDLTPDELTLIQMYRAVLDDVRQEIRSTLQREYDVAIKYQAKYSKPAQPGITQIVHDKQIDIGKKGHRKAG